MYFIEQIFVLPSFSVTSIAVGVPAKVIKKSKGEGYC
jgi:serine acetyltransferase